VGERGRERDYGERGRALGKEKEWKEGGILIEIAGEIVEWTGWVPERVDESLW